jgi:hypothetical protein
MGMDQYLLIPFLVGWTSIYQLFWCSPGVQGFDTLPHSYSKYCKAVNLELLAAAATVDLACLLMDFLHCSHEGIHRHSVTDSPF